jgi:predicted enzyme related to lactoylglutathione lyase
MDQSVKLLVFPAKDLDAAKALYGTLLGVEPYADASYYVGYRVGDLEIGLDPNGHQRAAGPIAYWDVPDIEAAIEKLVAAGARVQQPASEVGGGLRIALLADRENTTFGLRQTG